MSTWITTVQRVVWEPTSQGRDITVTFSPRQGSSLRRAEFCWHGVSSGVYGAINNVHGKLFSKLRIDPNGVPLVSCTNNKYTIRSIVCEASCHQVIRSFGHRGLKGQKGQKGHKGNWGHLCHSSHSSLSYHSNHLGHLDNIVLNK